MEKAERDELAQRGQDLPWILKVLNLAHGEVHTHQDSRDVLQVERAGESRLVLFVPVAAAQAEAVPRPAVRLILPDSCSDRSG